MKNKIISLILFISLFGGSGCQDYLDVNHDPNVLEEIPDAKVLLPSAEISLANSLLGWDFGFGGGFWVQYWTQKYTASQFKFLCEYNETSFSTAYSDFTAATLTDLEKIKQISSDSENKGLYFVAEALSIYTWQILTDVWGNIPYSEAIKGAEGIESPKFDDAESIYTDLNKRINALLEIDLSNSSIEGKYDFVYAGDLAEWYKFANGLKLKLMLRLSETSTYNNATVLSFVESADFLTSSAKIPGTTWSDGVEGKRHPMREFQEGGASYISTNVIGCKSFIDYLRINNDPRINTLFTAPSGGHQGAFFGDFDSKGDSNSNGTSDDKESYSVPLFKADMDLMIMSDWEVDFYISEVYARANNLSKAKEYYDLGVEASLSQHAITSDDILTSGYAKWVDNTAIEDNIKQIAMQKWVANANYQHIESFLERNRVKYPSVNEIDIKADRVAAFQNFPVGQLTISVNGRAKLNGNLPQSPLYPDAVLTRNINAPGNKANVGEKIWWNKKAGK